MHSANANHELKEEKNGHGPDVNAVDWKVSFTGTSEMKFIGSNPSAFFAAPDDRVAHNALSHLSPALPKFDNGNATAFVPAPGSVLSTSKSGHMTSPAQPQN